MSNGWKSLHGVEIKRALRITKLKITHMSANASGVTVRTETDTYVPGPKVEACEDMDSAVKQVLGLVWSGSPMRTCEDCGGTGWVREDGAMTHCETCANHGILDGWVHASGS